jgi:putative spermidine/putrescine transport system permease protein
MAETPVRQNPIDARPWTFYALGSLFALYLLFLYGPMLVIYALSFQGPNGGVTFPIVDPSLEWFRDVWRPGQMANIPVSFWRSMTLAGIVSLLTVVISVAAGLAYQRPFPGSGLVFYLAVSSLVMPRLLVGFGIGLGFQFSACSRTCSRPRSAPS